MRVPLSPVGSPTQGAPSKAQRGQSIGDATGLGWPVKKGRVHTPSESVLPPGNVVRGSPAERPRYRVGRLSKTLLGDALAIGDLGCGGGCTRIKAKETKTYKAE